MMNNPFTQPIFTDMWIKHFNRSQPGIKFDFIKDVTFVKNTFFPVYINVGKSHTKGVSYEISATKTDFKNKVFLLYDIPDYFEIENTIMPSSLKVIDIKQYPGYLVDIAKHPDITNYKKSKFGKSSLSKINKYKRKLESCFDITYEFYYGNISRENYNLIFTRFNELLEKRFSDIHIHNNNLDPKEWEFYHDVLYDMILQKKASIFVIYDGDKPIAGSINYHMDQIAIGAIMAFDTDYSKFYLGFTIINKLLEWAIENRLKVFDFSKGKFGYKMQWSDKEYDFHYHILYDNKSLKARLIASFMSFYLKSKASLREKNIGQIKSKLLYILKGNKKKNKKGYTSNQISEVIDGKQLTKVSLETENFGGLKRIVYDFLYSYSEHLNKIKVFQFVNDKKSFLIVGESAQQKISFE